MFGGSLVESSLAVRFLDMVEKEGCPVGKAAFALWEAGEDKGALDGINSQYGALQLRPEFFGLTKRNGDGAS